MPAARTNFSQRRAGNGEIGVLTISRAGCAAPRRAQFRRDLFRVKMREPVEAKGKPVAQACSARAPQADNRRMTGPLNPQWVKSNAPRSRSPVSGTEATDSTETPDSSCTQSCQHEK
jgi:hypothetical protein